MSSKIDPQRVRFKYKSITLYRKCRRAGLLGFLDYVGEEITDEPNVQMDEYCFMNTADLLLLNPIANLGKYEVVDNDMVVLAIQIIKSIF